MKYLLDVNVLVAWGWTDHVAHERTDAWLAAVRDASEPTLCTSAIPQLGFVRVSVQRTAGAVGVSDAAQVLHNMLESLGASHQFIADDQESDRPWPGWCHAANRTTDAHLLALAERHEAQLASLDESIPGAFLVPDLG